MAEAVRACGFNSVNISLDTLDRAEYARVTGRDLLPEAIAGHRRGHRGRFPSDKNQLRSDARTQSRRARRR